LKLGITTVRSAGDYTPEIFDFRDEVNEGRHISPRIIAAGKMIQARGGHPMDTVFESNENITSGVAVMVDDDTDIVAEIKLLIDAGADWIKAFIAEVNKVDYKAPIPRLSPDKISLIVDTAHKYGRPCMIHVDNALHLREAVEAGADSIEHLFSVGATETEISDDLIDLLVRKQTYIVPTICSIYAHEDSNGSMPLVYEKLIQQVNKLIRLGVNIGVGTDSAIPFLPIGVSLHDELSHLVKCGMTPSQAISAATSGNAKLLRMEGEIGVISPGCCADLFAVDGDPTADISNAKNIRLVIMNGRIVVDNT
jgi:imidazolonepropionase-like amidohydrolase